MSTEAKCPFTHTAGAGPSNRDWVAQSAEASGSWPVRSMGQGFNYAKEFKSLDLAAVKKDLTALMNRLAGLVAGGLRPLWTSVHSHGMACRWHVPHPRRPRRRR